MSQIIPGILEQEWTAVEKKIELVRPFAKTVHIDLLDGKFAENKTFMDPKPFAKYRSEMEFELHMMVEDPLRYVKPFAEAGFRRFLGHIEQMPDQAAFVAEAEQYGEVGLAVDAKTSLDHLKVSYEDLDCLLVMTVHAGFSGQEFLPSSLPKIQTALKKHPLLTVEVDGGVTEKTLKDAFQAGARRFIVNSALFAAEDTRMAYHSFAHSVAALTEQQGLG